MENIDRGTAAAATVLTAEKVNENVKKRKLNQEVAAVDGENEHCKKIRKLGGLRATVFSKAFWKNALEVSLM